MTRMTRPDCAVMCNLINTHTHTHMCNLINTHTHTHTHKPDRGRSGQFMGCPSGGRGPSRERDRNSTSRSRSRMGGGEERGAGGGGGGVGAGVLGSENNGRIRW